MNLDGLTMSVLAKELNERLQTGQIQKLYQIDKTTLLFKIRALNEDQSLVITVGATPQCISVNLFKIYQKNLVLYVCFFANILKEAVL